jgi:autotransporter-associated beta strand protein
VINANLNFSAATATLDPRQNTYGAATTLEINGAISGASTAILGGGSNAGAATLRLSGTTANTFTGTFGVAFGANHLVEFNKTAGVDAIGTGGISLTTAGNYKWLASNQINDSAPIIMEGGTLNLNGFNETVASFTSGVTGGANNFVNSTEGTLTLAGTTGNVLSLSNNAANTSKTLDMNLALSGSGGNISFAPGASTGSGRLIQIGGTTPGARTLDLGSVVRTINVADGAQAVDALITSQITGTGGGFNKTGAGVLSLTSANTFSGDTKVTAGTLILGNSNTLQNSALDTSGAGAITITGLNALTLGGLKGSTNLTSVITTGSGSLYSLTLNPGTGVTNTYSGVISDGSQLSLTKTGLGTQVLTGTNTYSGATTIRTGMLSIGSTGTINSTSGVTIGTASTAATTEFKYNSTTALTQAVSFAAGSTGGTLSGSGTINVGVNVTAGNTLAIGNSIGEMTFGGNLEIGGTYLNEITGGGITADLGVVSGNLTLGGILDLVQLGTFTAGDKFTLFAYNGTLTGLFKESDGFTSILDDTNFTDAGGIWTINYNDATAGLNGGVSTSNTYITITAIPEPNVAALLGGLGVILLLRRRR